MLREFIRPTMITLLTRMQTSKTDTYVYCFVYFVLYTMAINVEGLTPDVIPDAVEGVQPGYVHSSLSTPRCMLIWSIRLWSQILTNFVIPQIPKMRIKDKKLTAIGVTRLLTQSTVMLSEPSVRLW